MASLLQEPKAIIEQCGIESVMEKRGDQIRRMEIIHHRLKNDNLRNFLVTLRELALTCS
jgi:hypothetical protein